MSQKRVKYLWPLLLIAFMWLLAQRYWFRDLWFDEALTILNFALLPDWSAIYHNYVIPNNQIVYTILLQLWFKLIPAGFQLDIWARLLSVVLACGVILILYFSSKVRYGQWNLLIALAALVWSPPFLLYATAVRGYMASAFFVVLTWYFARNFTAHGKWYQGVGYFVGSFLTLGTIPSNLVALAGVGLYVLPGCGAKFWRQKRFWWLLVAPFGAGILFYAPIARNFVGVLKLGEGWSNPWGVALALLAVVLGMFGMLLLPGLGSMTYLKRAHFNWWRSARWGIWLLPIPAIWLWGVAPFPRVFFPLFPLWALLIAGGLADFSAQKCRLQRRWKPSAWYGGMLALVVLWSCTFAQNGIKTEFSLRCGGAESDDFFYPYYLRPGYEPAKLMMRLAKQPENLANCPLYFSFKADPWPLMFYHQLSSSQVADYYFDGPRGRVARLTAPTIVIISHEESPKSITARFGGNLQLLWRQGYHQVGLWQN